MSTINGTCLTLCEENSSLKTLFEQRINGYISLLQNVSLSNSEALQEVESIKKLLPDGEMVGYFFTGGIRMGEKHFEPLLITKNKVIKPVYWAPYDVPYETSINNDFYSTNLRLFSSNTIPHPQADTISCGTLGICSLKKLLQNNAKELNSSSLTFSIYYKHSLFGIEKINFFFPPPSLLKYSQSSSYIIFLKKILSEKEFEEFDTYQISTLLTVLKKSIEIAKEKNDSEIEEENLQIMARLPMFRQKWLEEVKEIKEKREQMNHPETKINTQLAYTTYRFDNIIKNKYAAPNSSSLFKQSSDKLIGPSIPNKPNFSP